MGSNDRSGFRERRYPRPSSSDEQVGGASKRNHFRIQRFAPEGTEDRHEYYVQIVISRKAAILLTLFLTVVLSLVDTCNRIVFPV
jgi:hypothetical protein